MNTQKAVVVSREIWLPPSNASLPNVCMVANNIPTNNTMGRRETKGEGIFFNELILFVISVKTLQSYNKSDNYVLSLLFRQ